MWFRFTPHRVQAHRPLNANERIKVAVAAVAVPIVGITGVASASAAGDHAEPRSLGLSTVTTQTIDGANLNLVTVRLFDLRGSEIAATGAARCDEVPASLTAIGRKYQTLGGCDSVLGAPTKGEQDTPNGVGRRREFEDGAIYSSPRTGVFEVHGRIYERWRELGGEGGFLGFPLTDEKTTPDGVGRYTHFEGGSIYWTPDTNAFAVFGAIRDAWAKAGSERSPFGYPISDERDVPGGRASNFQFGSIEWNARTGAITPTLKERPARVKVLPIEYQVQQTGYWCGPAATRMALSARVQAPSQARLAAALGTTQAGTDWIGQITRELNRILGPVYRTTEMPGSPPTQSQRERLWNDLVRSIDNGYPVVANIVAPPHNHPPGYPDRTIYHYIAVNGYDREARQVHIADSASFSGKQQYWLSFDQLATLIPPKGYSAFAGS